MQVLSEAYHSNMNGWSPSRWRQLTWHSGTESLEESLAVAAEHLQEVSAVLKSHLRSNLLLLASQKERYIAKQVEIIWLEFFPKTAAL